MQFVTLAFAGILLYATRHLARATMCPTVLQYPELLPTSRELRQVYLHDTVLHVFEPLPNQQLVRIQSSLYILRMSQLRIRIDLGLDHGLESGQSLCCPPVPSE